MLLLILVPILIISFIFLRLFGYFIWLCIKSRYLPGPECNSFFFGNFLQTPKTPTEAVKYLQREAVKLRAAGENLIRVRGFCFYVVMPLDGEGLRPLLNSSEEITKAQNYEIMKPWIGEGLLTSTGSKWHGRRRLLTPAFHYTILQGNAELVDNHARILLDIISEQQHGVVDIYELLRLCSLDVICDTAMSYDLDAQRNPDQTYIKAVAEFNHIASMCTVDPRLYLVLGLGFGYAQRYKELQHILTAFTTRIIMERIADYNVEEIKPGRKAFLDIMIAQRVESGMTIEDIREEVDTFMFAGHDTTSSAMSWFLWCMATNPEIQSRVREEIDEIFEHSADRSCTMADIGRMEYFDRCIKESLRLFSPAPSVGRVLLNDLTIGKHVVPAGSNIFITPALIHNNDQVYKDVRKFDPDRFLPENVAARRPFDYIPFSAGARNCIGQKFALIEMKVIISWVLRRFTLTSTREQDDITAVPEVVLRPAGELPITFHART